MTLVPNSISYLRCEDHGTISTLISDTYEVENVILQFAACGFLDLDWRGEVLSGNAVLRGIFLKSAALKSHVNATT